MLIYRRFSLCYNVGSFRREREKSEKCLSLSGFWLSEGLLMQSERLEKRESISVLMTCEELLSVWTVQRSIEKEQRRLVDLRILAAPPAPHLIARLDGMPHANPVPVDFGRIAGMIVDCRLAIDRLGEIIEQRKFQLLTKLQSLKLKELQQRVLTYRYVACRKFREIAEIMNFTYSYIHMLHRKGLKALGLTVDELNKAQNSAAFVD